MSLVSHTMLRRLWSLTMACIIVCSVQAQDTLKVIDEIIVRSDICHHETIAPQVINGEQLASVSAHTVADAIRWMSGVQLKDYGGIGGLKTINLRSMGSQHLGIYYDGIELGNAQNGVIDLGQLSLDNVEEISLYNGQRSSIFQTASDFVNAGSVYIRTVRPSYKAPLTRIKLQYGSSSTVRASVMHARTMGDDYAMNVNVEALSSSGKYPFTYRRRNLDGSIAYDTTAVRQNGDISSFRAEANLYGKVADGELQGKLYTFHADRGIPGAIVNNVWRRGERQSDHNTMLQASWQRDVVNAQSLRIQGKYAYYNTHYLNKDTTLLMIDNTYRQHEAYANITYVAGIRPWTSLSLSYDLRWNHLSADIPQFAHPSRFTHMLAIADALDLNALQLQASCVASYVNDHAQGKPDRSSSYVTPALFCSYAVNGQLMITGFAKRSLRMPTFNDLYYTEIGNAMLKPEIAQQYAVGLKLNSKADRNIQGTLHIDLYHNSIKDKIVAYPKGQQFRWTMLNLGQVNIDGLEVRTEGNYRPTDSWKLNAMLQYTLQFARDVTDRHTSYYGDQIPYTPVHSGSASVMIDYRRWTLAYNFVYTGERYCQPENIAYNHLQPWYTSDITLSTHWARWRMMLEVRNLFNQQYDVIINYPMPGTNFNLTLQCEL